jgi:peptidyl-prolyl cis-trans isomerase C
MKTKALSTLVAAGFLCAMTPLALAQNLAIVNGKAVPQARMELLTEQLARSGREITPELQAQIKSEIIAREVFAQEAQKLGLGTSEVFKRELEFAQQNMLIRELFLDFEKNHPVSDAETKAEYDRFVTANKDSQEYLARHILVETPEAAKAIIARLKKGAKFDDLAKKNSKDPGSAAKGGALDWANPNNYVPEFAQALTQLGKGKFTETPVQSKFGYHIIRLDNTRKIQLPKFDDVKMQVVQQLQQRKLSQFQEQLRAKATIE